MKVNNVKNPKWANSDHSTIECDVNFEELGENYVSFGAVAFGDMPYTHEIFSRCIAGEFGPVADYEPPKDFVGDAAMSIARSRRDHLLSMVVDPIVYNPMRWADMTAAQQQAWSDYRRALLDITTTCPNPSFVWNEDKQDYDEVGITWPVKPE